MKFTHTLSGRLLLALSITVPTVFLSTFAGAEPLTNQPTVNSTRLQSTVNFAPSLAGKVDVLRPGSLVGKDGFRDSFRDAFKEKGKSNPANAISQPGSPASAVNTLRSLSNVR